MQKLQQQVHAMNVELKLQAETRLMEDKCETQINELYQLYDIQ